MDKRSDRGVALFISVLLHSLFVLLPWQETSPPLAVSSPPTPPTSPISIVDASQIPTLPAESQPLPTVPSSPPALDAPITETNDSPIEEPAPPAPEVVPYSDPVPETTPPVVPSTPNSVTPADAAKIAADWEHLVGYLEEQDDGLEFYDLLGIFSTFGKPGQVNQFFDENNQPKLDVFSFYHFTKQTPEQVLQAVVKPEITSNTGFEHQLQEDFSAGQAYQLSQGEMLRYLIIVRLNEGSGSVLILSHSLPGLEP